MKKLTEEELNNLKEYGAVLMPLDKVAIIFQVNQEEFINEVKNSQTEANKAYYTGFYLTEIEIRKSIISLAKGGSSPAQTQAIKLWEDAKNVELLND